MSRRAVNAANAAAAMRLPRGRMLSARATGWNLAGLSGRLVELSGAEESAVLTMAFGLVREAQLGDEPVAWITLDSQAFYPPDAAVGGVDLDALVVVRAAKVRELARAADHLARSSAFGLLVLDLAENQLVAMPILSRLLGLAQKHDVAILFLTRKPATAPSLGSLVSLRGQASRRRTGHDHFTCELLVVKDKRHAPGWSHVEICRGPAGLH